MNNAKLIEQAQDSRDPLLTLAECNLLWEQANAALLAASLSEAYASVEALLCQADREGEVLPDLLPESNATFLSKGYSPAQVQGLIDRIESLNFHASHRHVSHVCSDQCPPGHQRLT